MDDAFFDPKKKIAFLFTPPRQILQQVKPHWLRQICKHALIRLALLPRPYVSSDSNKQISHQQTFSVCQSMELFVLEILR